MTEIVSLARARDDKIWAVIAQLGRQNRVAAVFSDRNAALADQSWREQQVRAYAAFLKTSRKPVPCYTVTAIHRAELPRAWQPLPALGFLRGQFI